MTQQLIITTPANTGTGDSPKSAFDKCNANFSDLYTGGASFFTAPGAPAAISIATALTAQPVNVTEYGATGNGVTDDTNAFNIAAQNCRPAAPYSGSTIANSPAGDVYVPPGTYLISSQINTNGANITWTLADGATITPSTSYALLNGRILRAGKQDTQYTYGIFYNAAGFSTRNNVPIDSPPAVMGFLNPSQISAYPTCDSVACYADNTAVPPLAIIAASGTTYTTTTISFSAALSATILGQIRVGMIVQTTNDPVSFYSGFVTAWTTNSITVSGWYQQGNAGAGQAPPNANGAWLSPVTKIFGFNGNVTLRSGTGYAAQAAGFEIGCLNNNAAPSGFIGTQPLVWGYDCVNLGTFACDTAFNARHNGIGFFTGFQVSGLNNAGTTVYGYFDQTVHGASVTALGVSFISAPSTVASTNLTNRAGFQSSGTVIAASTVGTITHFNAVGATISGTTTTQVGFLSAALTGATNNRGFVGQVASAANNYNLYMSGTAQNFLQGVLGLGVAPSASNGVTSGFNNTLTGVTQTSVTYQDTLSGTSNSIATFISQTIAASTAVSNYVGAQVSNVSLSGGATVTNNIGFKVAALSSGTNNYGFLSAVAAGANNVAFYAQGTAVSIFGGVVNISATSAAVSSGIGFGGTTQTTVGATGAASALPANPLGYLVAYVGATKVAIPYYNG